MRVIKKINNNAAICLDNHDKELVAFGKGIGFPKMPYEIDDLSVIDRTFYNISSEYYAMMNEIPSKYIEFSARMIDRANQELQYDLNPNAVLSLADHISFSIERHRKNIYVRMPLAYEVSQLYPQEMKLAKFILDQIYDQFKVRLKSDEASGIAMNFVNARLDFAEGRLEDNDALLDGVTQIVETELRILIDRETFNYSRYATHILHLLNRIQKKEMVDTDNLSLYDSVKEEYAEISACVDKICQFLNEKLNCDLIEEEKLYLILHVNRVCAKEGL